MTRETHRSKLRAAGAAEPPGPPAEPAPVQSAVASPRRRDPVRRALGAWVSFWNRREPPTSLALVRILVALVLLADLLQSRSYGVVEAIWGPPPDGMGWGATGSAPPLAVRLFGASIDTAWIVWWTGVASALLLCAGAATRLSALTLALVWAQLGNIAPDSDRGIDFLLRAVLLVLVFSSCHARWSVDAWVRRRVGRPFPALVPAWPRYLLLLQLVWVYFSAGYNKTDKAWGPLESYTALGNIMTDPHFARFDPGWVSTFYPLLQIATAMTMVFELGAPAMLLFTYWSATRDRPGRVRRAVNLLRLRWVWIVIGVTFHVGIAMTMRLGIFPWGMLALYPVLFHPDEIAGAWTWLASRLPRPIAPRSPSG